MIATNKGDNSVEDARQEDFQVFEDDLPRTIALFAKDLRRVDYGIVVDKSQSFAPLLKPVVVAAKSLVSSKHPEDEVFIESFVSSSKIENVLDFTADKAKLIEGLNSLYISGGQSAVVDAAYLAIKHMVESKGSVAGRRRAVVLFTDGEDRASYYGSDQVVKLIRENDVQVFVVGLVDLLDNESGLTRASPRVRAERFLNKIAEESGGRAFFPKGVNELLEATAQIAHDLHFQYLIGFVREIKPGEKGFRKVKIKFSGAPGREKLRVIARPGFLLAPDSVAKAKQQKSL